MIFLAGCKDNSYKAPPEIATQVPTATFTLTPEIPATQPLLPRFPTSTPYLTPPPEPYEACPGDFPSELQVGMPAMVGLDSASARSQPGNDQPVVAGLSAGTLINIVGGPECFEGQTWWQITTSSMPGSGWVFEADMGRPYISPVQTTGSISGTLDYPGGDTPAMRVLALHLSGDIKDGYYGYDQVNFYTDLTAGQREFTILNLPNGFYWIIAVPLENNAGQMGAYALRSECLSNGKECEGHDLIPIPLGRGEAKNNFIIADWSDRETFTPLITFNFLD